MMLRRKLVEMEGGLKVPTVKASADGQRHPTTVVLSESTRPASR
jgi:hypothetical protein